MSRLATLSAWADAMVAARMDEIRLARRRARLWETMRPHLARTPALRAHASSMPHDIEPVAQSAMRTDIGRWNSAGIRHDEAMSAALGAEAGGTGLVRDGIAAGLSTGTSGARGLFLASTGERARYVGQSVAKLLPASAPIGGARIALVLRADSQLYRDAGRGRFAFMHVPLGMDAHAMADALDRFAPTVVIAPPRELSALAASGRALPPAVTRLLWGSEPMAPRERGVVGRALGIRPDPIYQATEGFIAAACALGTLHLNDDSMIVDLEPVEGLDAFRPIVTDLRRHVQPMVRVRMDDLVRPTTCACGSACRAIEPVLGRAGDAWTVGGRKITPERIDDHFAAALPRHAAWSVRGGEGRVTARVADAADMDAMRGAIRSLDGSIEVEFEPMPDGTAPKRRRVTWGGEKA
jgi:putative adenylate-forming enzyme